MTYEADAKGFHLLSLDYDMAGIIELAVTFFSNNCAKQRSISFEGICKSLSLSLSLTHTHTHITECCLFITVQRAITNVSYNAENATLNILTRGCFDRNHNFTVTVMYTVTSGLTMSKRHSLSPHLMVHLGNQLENVTSFNFTVIIIEDASGVVVDEFSGRYIFTVQSKFAEL